MFNNNKNQWTNLLCILAILVLASIGLPTLAQAQNWPMYQHDEQRSGSNQDPSDTITPANATGLAVVWGFATNGAIQAEPILVNGVVYIGSSDGTVYAVNAQTGEQIWQRQLGLTPKRGCDPPQLGVGSSALYHQAAKQALIYVAGPDEGGNVFLYALDATTGQIRDRQQVGASKEGAYGWSSPVIINDRLFYGVASQGDLGSPSLGSQACPFVRGRLLVFDLDPETGLPQPNPQEVTFAEGQTLGGGVFSTPAVDVDTGTLYLTTGSAQAADRRMQPQTSALVALDTSTLQIRGRWQLPGPLSGVYDLSSGPILFTGNSTKKAKANKLVGVGARNNAFYALDADDPSHIERGPVWIQQIGDRRGKNLREGEGVTSNPAFINGTLYVGGGDRCFNTGDRGCTLYIPGSVVALDPSTGRIKSSFTNSTNPLSFPSRHITVGRVIGALTGSNQGLLYVPSAQNQNPPDNVNRFEVVDARDGKTLSQFSAGDRLWSGAAAAENMVFVGSYDGTLYALRVNESQIEPPDPQAGPSGLDGEPGDGVVTLKWISRGQASEFTIQRRLHNGGIEWETIGTVAAGQGDRFQYVDTTAENSVIYEYRVIARFNDGKESDPSNLALAIPSAGVNPDWAQMDIGSERAGAADYQDDGIVVSGGGGDIFGSADQFHYVYQVGPNDGQSNVQITARLTQVTPTSLFTKAGVMIRAKSGTGSTDTGSPQMAMFYLPPPGTGLESNWRTDFYGGTTFAGHIAQQLPTWVRVRRRGQLLEAFYSVDGESWARVGPAVNYADRLRDGVVVGLAVTAHDEARIAQAVFDHISIDTNVPPQPPFNVRVQSRKQAITIAWDAAPGAEEYRIYRQQDRIGTFEAIATVPASKTMYVDSDVQEHTVYFYRISSLNKFGEEFSDELYARLDPPTNLNGFRSMDIGTSLQGDADINPDNEVLSVFAAGSDIWGNADSFRYTFKPMCGDGEVSARLRQMDRVEEFTKAGIMIREAVAENQLAGAKNFALLWTGEHGFRIQWRTSQGGGTSDNGYDIAGRLGMYLHVVRQGDNFRAYLSEEEVSCWPDASKCTAIGPQNGVTVAMGTAALQGIAVTSHNNARGALAEFDSLRTGPEGPNDPNDPPLRPGQLTVDGGIRRIFLTWGPACNAVRYIVLRGTSQDNLEPIASLEETRFTDEDVELETPYFYRIVGVNANGDEGEPSNIGSARAIPNIDFSGGFTDTSNLTRNGNANFVQNLVRLTDGGGGQAGSVFANARAGTRNFTTTFTFQLRPGSTPMADGMCFVIQSNSPTALGPAGGGLGYGPDQPIGPVANSIRNSICVKFDLYNNAGEGTNSTGIFTDGRSPTVRQSGLPDAIPDRTVSLDGTGINLHSQHVFEATLTYDGTTLRETIRDTETMTSHTVEYRIDIPSFTGETAFVGFTGGTGGLTAIQDVRTWRFDAP